DYLRLLAYGVLLVGVWRAIRGSEFGRAVAEERARVAREIHDGLAQYLFAVSTHASMLEAGADPAETIPRLKEAALAAQQEAKYAWVSIGERAGERVVTVRDDGAGFSVEESTAGHGLRNMRERAASIGGALTLRSAPGSGTALEVVLRT